MDALDTRATVSVGMAVALASIAMTFAALLLAYAIVRAQAPAWPPPGEAPLPPLWGWRLAATAAALGGSWAMQRAARATDVGRRRVAVRALLGAALCGGAFLAVQCGAFATLRAAGVAPSSGLAASVVYALSLFHGLHALVALALLVPTVARGGTRVHAVAAFWHLVTAVWVVMFLAVFVA
jgi:cytochrome c oxidase subunit 3